MQIHELNDFSGSMDAGTYVALDNGADTGKASIPQLLSSATAAIEEANARIDNIIAGGDAPSAAEIIDARRGGNGINYASLGAAIRGQYEDLNEKKVNNTVVSFNKFNPESITDGYVSYQTGEVISNANFYTSDFIPVNSGERYKIENTGNNQLALYDTSKEYTTGFVNANTFNLTDIPDGSAYVRFCFPRANIASVHFYRNDEYVPLKFWDSQTAFKRENVADKLASDVINYETTVSTIADFLIAVNNILLTDGYHYTIYLEEGTYELDAAAISTLTNPTYGIMLPDNTDLIGLGSGAVINCDLTGQSPGVQSLVSPINIKANNKLKNLTIIANNCRYAVHADNSNTVQDNEQHISDCTFIHKGNSDNGWYYPAAWGAGTSSGSKVTFENCKFIAPFRAFFMHNNVNFDKPSETKFKDCEFVCIDNRMAFSIESMGSGVKDLIVFDGCSFNQELDCRIQNSGVTANDFRIIGHGCGKLAVNFYYTDGKTYTVELTDQMERIYNSTGANIANLTPMKYDSGLLVPMENGDNTNLCVGVTIEPISNEGNGMMQFKGYLNVSTVSGVYELGQKIGVINGALTVVNTDEYIGVVKYINTLHNRKYMEFK